MRVWSPKDGSCVIELADPKGVGTYHQAPINCLDVRGSLIMTGSEDCTSMLVSLSLPAQADVLPTAKVVVMHKCHEESVESVAICPTMPFVASGRCVQVFVRAGHRRWWTRFLRAREGRACVLAHPARTRGT